MILLCRKMDKKSQIRAIGILLIVAMLSVIVFAFSITEQDGKTIIQTADLSINKIYIHNVMYLST
jgi:hypothetical protein